MTQTLIANTGIHLLPLDITIDLRDKYTMWFREWYDASNGEWNLELAHPVNTETNQYFYDKKTLKNKGYLSEQFDSPDEMVSALNDENIRPLKIDEEMQAQGIIYRMSFGDKHNLLDKFIGQWLPLPYFYLRAADRYQFAAFNWCRFKLIPADNDQKGSERKYHVLLAFDTRTLLNGDKYKETPTFPDPYATEMKYRVCDNEMQLLSYTSPSHEACKYINDYLFSLAHPNLNSLQQVRSDIHMNYVATYVHLIHYIAQHHLFPDITLYKDSGVECKDVDMVIDIGNSRTTALLVEDNSTLNQTNQLRLVDFTKLLDIDDDGKPHIKQYNEPFDMRLAFRKVNLGNIGIKDSRQFVYPSFVRLGQEATYLIHRSTEQDSGLEKLTTHSSPKRYLWDKHPTREEWKFLVLDGEADDHILTIPGLSEKINNDGTICTGEALGGQKYNFSNRSLMTFAFLEMLVQALAQINDHQYRVDRGDINMPRRIRHMIITCPTAMSKLEREALVKCASDAVKLLNHFYDMEPKEDGSPKHKIDIIPQVPSFRDLESKWYYDEATCSQLVYIYGEIGYKYRGACQEFFKLYGKTLPGEKQPSLTIGSIDIGAGTSDLMICKYDYKRGDVTTVIPDPLFYDSYYYAGDDMLNELVKKAMFFSPRSALRRKLNSLDERQYRQKLRNFFGPDHSGQTVAQRKLRRDFNMQYSVPLMHYFLQLLSQGSSDCTVRYSDVFSDNAPNQRVLQGFKDYFGFDLQDLSWEYNSAEVNDIVHKAFEPLLKKIATIMHSYDCDIVLLSGRPASLPPIRDIFLKYYSVSPNRLILLNNYFVGYWYPFSNNTGYIAGSKSIVAIGALIGYYATTLANLDRFVIDKSKLDSKLKSTINYIEASREDQPISYFITPEQSSGELMVSSLPTRLSVRQIGLDSYPSRKLYTIDFNKQKIHEKIKRKAILDGTYNTDGEIIPLVNEYIDRLKLKMPFTTTIERDPDDKEKLSIVAIHDRNGEDILDSNLEISLRSLDNDDNYWLDNGAFEIQ